MIKSTKMSMKIMTTSHRTTRPSGRARPRLVPEQPSHADIERPVCARTVVIWQVATSVTPACDALVMRRSSVRFR